MWGTRFGLPALGAGIVATYAALTICYHVLWDYPPDWQLYGSLGLYGLVAPIALYFNGLHTVLQIVWGLFSGGVFGAICSVWTRTFFLPYLLPVALADPNGLGWIVGHHDSYLRYKAPPKPGYHVTLV